MLSIWSIPLSEVPLWSITVSTTYGDNLSKAYKSQDDIISIFKDFVEFLENQDNVQKFHPYSPEYHGVIRCGRGVSPKPNLNEELYERLLQAHVDTTYKLPAYTDDYIRGVVNSDNLMQFKRSIRAIPDVDDKEEDIFNFLENIFRGCHKLYSTSQKLESRETAFNDLLIFSFLKSVSETISECVENCKAEFEVGETPLIAMKKQLDDTDEATLYYADGIIKLYGVKEVEVLLLETSSFFGCTNNAKKVLIIIRGSFGTLAMIKTIADIFCFGPLETFGKVKILFVHAAGIMYTFTHIMH
ncbi:hypothetical protein G6F44_010886 [Rhizopus delemar]|nr:hypothetical protein G6F44_010886 [Rhizopus delemar]